MNMMGGNRLTARASFDRTSKFVSREQRLSIFGALIELALERS
jgi:hypothetical protein